ncbi:MAG: alginate O-acetyltransferase AlgX-related protein [Alphaproteobacteria bacterium]
MRSALTRRVAFCLIGAVLFAAAGYLGNRISPVYQDPDFAWVSARSPGAGPIGPKPAASQVAVTLGNSHSVAIDFDALTMSGRHLWMSGADTVEAAVVARHAVAVPSLRAIFMPVFPENLYLDNAGRRAEPRLRTYQLMFTNGDLRLLGDDYLGWIRWALSFIQRPDRWRGVVRAVFCDDPPCDAPYPRTRLWQQADPLGRESVARTVGEIYVMIEPRLGKRRQLATSLAALEEAARAATARGIPLVLFAAPVSTPLERRLDERVLRAGHSMEAAKAGFNDWLRDARGRGLCVTYADRLWDPASDGWNAAFYRDPQHLNPPGAREFSGRLARQIEPLPACAPTLAKGAARR